MAEDALKKLRERRYQHLQCHKWGCEEFAPDDRAGPKDHNPECPSCPGIKMVYCGESKSPYGDLYYCPNCKRGWRIRDLYWRHPANIRDGLSGDDLVRCPYLPENHECCSKKDSCVLVKNMRPLGAPVPCSTLPLGLIPLVKRCFENFGKCPENNELDKEP